MPLSPFFSIILATYNRARLLPRAIQSVFDQDFKDWELFICDDGSTDGTAELLKEFTDQDSRLGFLFGPNAGPAVARNRALPKIKGRYVCFLDSDDEFSSDHLSHHFDYFSKNPQIDFVYGKVQVIGDPYVPDRNDKSRKIHLDECVAMGSMFIKREWFTQVGGVPLVEFSEDRALYDRLIAAGALNAVLEYRSYLYHRNEEDSICNRLLKKAGLFVDSR